MQKSLFLSGNELQKELQKQFAYAKAIFQIIPMKTIQQKFLAHCRSSCNVKIEKREKNYHQQQVI